MIELLAVVAIIGVLAAIAIPQHQEYVVNASESACESEVAGYKTKVEAYLLDNDRYSEPFFKYFSNLINRSNSILCYTAKQTIYPRSLSEGFGDELVAHHLKGASSQVS